MAQEGEDASSHTVSQDSCCCVTGVLRIYSAQSNLPAPIVQNVDLPEVFTSYVQERPHRQYTGFADTALEIFQFCKFFLRSFADRRIESVLPHHQNTLRSNGKLSIQTQITKHVDHDRTIELFPKIL